MSTEVISEEAIETIEVEEAILNRLRAEHMRLNNPGDLSWDRFLALAVRIGLQRLTRLPVNEALALLEPVEG